jgi:hypothetical protein
MSTARIRLPLRVLASAAGVVVMGSLALADAPPTQYAAFDLKDLTILDSQTQLRWQRHAGPQTSFAGAIAYCAGLSLAGYTSGWRVPSYKELLTLVDESPHTEYPTGAPQQIAIDGNAFPNTAVDAPYWTSSPYPSIAGDAYVVEFVQGAGQSQSMGTPAYVRCVQ